MIQTFTTTTATCVFPVVLCSVLTFLMVLTSYDWWRFFLVTVITLVLNQTWIAVYMMIIYANPSNACHATLMVAILAGFASGFVVTQDQMPIGLVSSVLKLVISSQGRIPRRWEERPWEREWERSCLNGHRQFVFVFFFCRFNLLFYINPQLYGFSAITKVLLRNVHLKCEFESALNCISKDGNAVLAKFEFDSVNPFEYMMVSGPFFLSCNRKPWLPCSVLSNHARLHYCGDRRFTVLHVTPSYVIFGMLYVSITICHATLFLL